jgi:two-component system OmpR family response regulator
VATSTEMDSVDARCAGERIPSSQLRILVVEDYEDSAQSMKILLRLLGHDVEVAFDGIEAIAKAKLQQPDVVLLDIGLPGMSGWEVAKLLQQQATEKKPFLIAITGYGNEEDKRHSAEAGVDLHLLKPVDPQELAAVLRRFQRVIK